jgi:hypothetical protein
MAAKIRRGAPLKADEGRRLKHTIQFTDDMWDRGLRLSGTKRTHYELVMSLIRDHTT